MAQTTERRHELRTLASYRPGTKALLVIFETDCPTCQLALPYLNALAKAGVQVIGVSQDSAQPTTQFVEQMGITYPVELDAGFTLSRHYQPQSVPTLYLLDETGEVSRTLVGFDKAGLNDIAAALGHSVIAPANDGAPAWKPGCGSRHLEPHAGEDGAGAAEPMLLRRVAPPASRVTLSDDEDPFEYCYREFGDALPVIPPTAERVAVMLRGTELAPDSVIGRIPPAYGEATVEKIAANAVMAGCKPEMMRVLIPLVRALCDENFNAHGVQATTHFAAPLVIVNGPVREELGFWSRQNVFSNVSRTNSSVGRALQLMLLNIGGGRPDGIDMSALGNPGKFSYCIAENEEENPWEPFQVDRGFTRNDSTVTLFAAEPPRGVSEHTAAKAEPILRAICQVLATVWSYRHLMNHEALVVLCPEHAKTIYNTGFSDKQRVRDFLFENTGVPMRYYAEPDGGEGTQLVPHYREITIQGERCYQKFRSPEAIKIIVTGGTAGKFSAVIGSWVTGPAGSQMVTYPIPPAMSASRKAG
ncbi:MAG TPA: TlpA disulfide reductase family protein [Candidatus Angelobacter sp.]|jgi:peroxiredoxin|nr:TlpA disulfide reductase family protein [Candidatus Angelobacter sp.]